MNDAVATATSPADVAMTVEELAAATGVPVRTIRYYQTRNLLSPPERKGRAARYDGRHVERLALIAELQKRGLRLAAIVDVLANIPDEHSALPAWLGLGDTMTQPWTDDRPVLLTAAELEDRTGDVSPALLTELEQTGLVERRIDTTPVTYLVPSPALLSAALEAREAGVDLETSAATRRVMQVRLARLADELVQEMTERVSLARLAESGPAELAALIERVRPITRRAVDVVFAHEMERALREAAEPAAHSPRKSRGRRLRTSPSED